MAFSFAPQQQSQQQSAFSQTPSLFTPQQQQQQQPLFQQQQQQQQQQQLPQFQNQQQQQQLLYLFTNDKAPATYGTKWADLHPDSQKVLLQIEEKILEYRGESQQLDQCSRLYDSSVANDGFEPDATHIIQELGGVSTAMERQKAVMQELMTVVKDMLRNTEVAVRSFMMLRPRFVHPKMASVPNTTTPAQGTSTQPTPATIVPVYDFYNGLPKKPSPFFQQTVARFEKDLSECCQRIEELEQLLLVDSNRHSLNSSSSLLESLPKVMSNVHDFFVHVAAKVESIHQYIESMKTAYLADQHRRGEGNNPFLEADRRETAKQEAAAKRVHPTLHLPAVQQPSTQVAGLLASSAAPVASKSPPMALPAASMGSGSSLFSTPSIAASSSSIFSTPSIAASSSLFSTPPIAASSSSLFSTPSVAAPSSSLFSTPVAPGQTSSLFGASPQTPAIGASTPSFGTGASLFGSTASTSFATGAVAGSGASFGASFGTASKARAKSRPGRR